MEGVRRGCIALCLVAAFLAGCGGKHAAPPPPTVVKPVHHRPVVKRHRVVVTVLDGDTGRRVHGALVRIGRPRRPREPERERRAQPAAARPARRDGPRARLRRPRAAAPLPAQAPRRRPRLPREPPVADVRRDPRADAGAPGNPRQAALPRRLEPRPRHPDRVPGGRLGRRRVHREQPRHRAGDLDAERARALAPRHPPREDGRLARGRRRRPGRPRDGRRRPRARPAHRAPAVGAFHVGSPIESSPLVRDRIDYFGAWNGNVYALDLRTRKLRWVYGSGWKITSSAAIADRTLYIGNYGGRLLALAPGSGRLRWSAGVNGRIYGTPAVWAGRVFVPSSDGGSLTAFTTRGALPLARSTRAATSTPHRPSGRGHVYFGSYNGRLYSASARTGSVRWSVQTGGPVSGAPAVVDGVAYAGSFANRIVGVDADSGRTCSASRTASTCPSPGAAAGCSCTAIRVCTRWSHRNPGRNHSFE